MRSERTQTAPEPTSSPCVTFIGHDDLETTNGYLHAVAADKVAVIEALDGQLAGNTDASSSLTH
jgi:hypothetical protein